MYLEISTTHAPATDLGYLVHKNPAGVHEVPLAFGRAVAFFPEAGHDRCAMGLVLDVDPVALVRGGRDGGIADHYVNDRPYAASSFMSVAIARGLREALAGRSRERPDLAAKPIPLRATVGPVPVKGDAGLVRALFEPLGYEVGVESHPMLPGRPDWGDAPCVTLALSATLRLSELLSHLYVLLPVLDARKHYWVGEDEVAKLLARGGDWLQAHPLRETVTRRYLHRSAALVDLAHARLAGTVPDTDASDAEADEGSDGAPRMHDARIGLVADTLVRLGARKVLDLGCGEGRLTARLAASPSVTAVTGVDVGIRDLSRAGRRLAKLPPAQRDKATLIQGSLLYRDARFDGHDAAALVEVVEHVDPAMLPRVVRTVFAHARPRHVVVTTPNRDRNAGFPDLAEGKFRHPDHRFEFTRAEFADWVSGVCAGHGYTAETMHADEPDPELGPVTQMAVFTKAA